MVDNEKGANHKALGGGMLLAAWVLIFLGLTAFFGNWEKRQNNPNQQIMSRVESGIREITLQANRQHHYVASGEINGKTVTFLIDTGATDVSVPENLASELGLRKGYQGIAQTANGNVTVYSTTIDTLTLGALEFRDIRASINPGMRDMEVLLGMSALRQVELIQKNNQLTLRQNIE